MLCDVGKTASNQPKERIGAEMLAPLRGNDGHDTPYETIKFVPVRGVFVHGCLRKGNRDIAVVTGFWCSPGIAKRRAARRPPCGAAHEIRAGYQSQDRRGAR